MKKKLLLTSVALLSTGIAFAKNVDFDTVIKWNSEVISAALTKAGFIATSNAAFDVRKTHERILNELVKKQSFSLRQATQVCLDKCNMSDMLKNGRGQSGKKCPELCTGFVDSLVSVNNEFTKAGNKTLSNKGLVVKQADGTFKVYSADKKYYAIYYSTNAGIKKYLGICKYNATGRGWEPEIVVFETNKNTPVALLGIDGEDGGVWTNTLCAVGRYAYKEDFFSMAFHSSISDDGMPYELFYDSGEAYKDNLKTVKNNIDSIKKSLQNMQYIEIANSAIVKKYLKENEYNRHANDLQNKLQKGKDAVKEWNFISSEFTEQSWEKNDKLLKFCKQYFGGYGCSKYNFNINYEIEYITGCNDAINKLTLYNGKSIDYKDIQTETPEEAYNIAKRFVNPGFKSYIDESKVKCSSEPCKKFGDDVVTCTIGNVTYKVVFDDICQGKIEAFFQL